MRNLISQQVLKWAIGIRRFSSVSSHAVEDHDPKKCYDRMTGWQIHSYSDSVEDLQFSNNLKKPHIRSPSQLLVKIIASSVNPIDVAMMGGYGSTFLNTMRQDSDIEFPLTLGRDFVGTVVHKGLDIKNSDYKVGDKVWGVIPVHHQGCHCEFVAIDRSYVSKKPEKMSDLDASAVLYAGLTAWSGLFISGQLGGLLGALCPNGGGRGKRVLVLGASGGVGSLAIQILQAEGVDVVATCGGQDAVSLITNLGVTNVIDYTDPDSDAILCRESPYDIILDCAGKGANYASTLPWTFGSYVTFKSPLLKNFDEHGLITGSLKNVRDLLNSNVAAVSGYGPVKWGYFIPASSGIHYLKKLADHQKLLPIIDSTFKYEKLPEAYQRVQDGHLRGKVVVDFT